MAENTMKAGVWYGPKDLRVEEVLIPKLDPGKVRIKVAFTGICGTDLHEYLAGPIFIPSKDVHPLSKEKSPLILGHEFSGIVTEVSKGVSKVKEGDRVVVEPILSCSCCKPCLEGKYNLCEKLGFHGLSGGGGGFSEFTDVSEHMVHKLPDSLTFEQGALVEPASVALHAVRCSKFKPGDKVAVFGAGTIGLLIIETLRLSGASEIYAVEISEQRAAKALELGATKVINPALIDPVSAIKEYTKAGVDLSFEVTGVEKVFIQAIESTSFEGETVIVSIWETKAGYNPNLVVLKERSIRGIIAYRNVFPAVIKLMERGAYLADKLVTKKIILDDLITEGFEELVKQKTHIKILVKS